MGSTAPVPQAQPQTPPPGGGTQQSSRPLKVLVVDNNRPNRACTEALLSSCGFAVTVLQTAKQAMSLLEAAPAEYDLVLKQHDPSHKIDAARLILQLKSSDCVALRNLPVAVTSTCDGKEAVLRCLHLGAAEYLINPLRVNELLVLGTRISHGKAAVRPMALSMGAVPADWSCESADTEIHENEDDQGARPQQGGQPTDSVLAQNLCTGRASANRNSTTKLAAGCQLANDGSNAANGHGSNNVANGSNGGANGSNGGNGGSTTQPQHMYMFRRLDGAVPSPLAYGSADGSGSGQRSGSGNSRGNSRDGGGGDGSGQGSGSGNEDLARRQLASESPQLRALGAAVAAATAADDDGSGKEGANATQGRGSNGNSGVGDADGDAVAAAKRETHDASMRGTAQGKREASMEPTPEPPSMAAPGGKLLNSDGSQSPKALPEESQQVVLRQSSLRDSLTGLGAGAQPASASPVGFRAWVSQVPQVPSQGALSPTHHGLKRKAGSVSMPVMSLPGTGSRSVRGKTGTPPNFTSGVGRFSSGGTGTGASDGTGTNFGSGGLLTGSSARQSSTPLHGGSSAAVSQPSTAMPLQLQPSQPPSLQQMPQQQSDVQPTSLPASLPSSMPQGPEQHGSQAPAQTQQQDAQRGPQSQPQQQAASGASLPMQFEGSAAWNGASTASALAMQQLQQMQAVAAAQQQQGANNPQFQAQQQAQQQQFQQAQMNAQMRGGYGGNFQYGGMPPHMVPPNFAPAPFGAWGSYAAAAQQASAGLQQQQQLMAFAQQMQQQAQQQAQQAAAGQGGDQGASTAQQQAQQQQMQLQAQQMMMAGYPAFLLGGQFGMGGGMPGAMPGGFGNFQAGWAQAQQQAAAHAAAGNCSQQPPHSQQTRAPLGGNGNPRQHMSGASPFAAASSFQAAAAAGQPGAPHPSAAAGDFGEQGDATNGGSVTPDGETALTRQPTPKEFRAQALSKFKQKRKNLCFTKKIRYESRKQLAQARPRVKGQFVRVGSAGTDATGAEVEVVDGGEAPCTAAALADAVAAGTARLVPEEEAKAAGLGCNTGATLPAGIAADDDGADSDGASDVVSPRGSSRTLQALGGRHTTENGLAQQVAA